MNAWLRVAREPAIVRRACQYAVGVGALLIAINHGDAILQGDISLARLFRMALTVLVPYAVSTASSVSAVLDPLPQKPPFPSGSVDLESSSSKVSRLP
jgi:hypothetical protein